MISREPTTRMQTAEHVLRSLEALVRGEATADVSLEEIGGRRPNTGSQPLQAPPGSQPLRAPSGSQPLQAPSGSQPLQAPSGSFPMRPPSGSSPLNALPREHSSDSMERAAYYPPHTTGPVPGVGDEDGELPMAWLIGGLVAILLCLALVISVGVKMLDQPEKPAPRTLHIPPSLSATPDEPVTPTAAKPVAKPVKPELAAPDGCGKAGAPFLGAGELHVDEVLEKKTVRVYIPKGYDPKVPQPVLVAFHDVQQTPQAALERFGLDKLADREGLIVLLPYDDGLAVWKKPRGVQRAYDDFLAAQTVLCIDKDRVYGFGHGAGGRAAARMPCDFPGVTAIATTAFRTEPDERECLAEKRVPYLHVAATKDHASPPKGGRGCGGTRAISIREYETEYRQHHDCAPRTRKWKSEKNAVCDTWECKEADFVSCRVEGGREWPGPVRSVDKAAEMFVRASCDGKPADFPYQDTIWQFFEEVTPKPEADK